MLKALTGSRHARIFTGRETAHLAFQDILPIHPRRNARKPSRPERGKRIPEDVAVIGFDDMPLCAYTSPTLTTVRVPKQEMGRAAAKRLLDKIKDGLPPVKIEVGTSLIRRASA